MINIELMSRVRSKILSEPKRIDMGHYARKRFYCIPESVCGTVCCIAGHAIEQFGGRVPDERVLRRSVSNVASELLWLNYDEAELLFWFHHAIENDPYVDLAHILSIYKHGSRDYAQIVAMAIDRCIERNVNQPVRQTVGLEDVRFAESVGIRL